MKRMKFLGYTLLIAVLLACLIFAFTACDDNDEQPTPIEDVEEEVPDFHVEDYEYFEIDDSRASEGKIEIKKIKYEYKDVVTEMVIPDTCALIYGGAFKEMKNLRKVTLPNVQMGRGVFENCKKLVEVVFSDDFEFISQNCFFGCSSLKDVVFPSSLKGVCAKSFYGTAWFDAQPDGVIYYGTIAYAYKGNMPKDTTVAFREGTTVIADYFFEDCDELVEVIMPDSVVDIGSCLFRNCKKLKSVKFSENITHPTRFYDCPSIKEVVFPDKVETLYSNTFHNCASLMSITVGKNYKQTIIGWFEPVVRACPRLVQVYNRSNIPIQSFCFDGLDIYFYSEEGGNKLVETEKDTYYLVLEQEKRFVGYFGSEREVLFIDADTSEVVSGAFYNSKVKRVILPYGVKKIGRYAFCGDSLVETVIVPASIEEIDDDAFESIYYYVTTKQRPITVYYEGTMAQWDAVIDCEDQMSTYVICKDGTISLNKDHVPFAE